MRYDHTRVMLALLALFVLLTLATGTALGYECQMVGIECSGGGGGC